MGIETVFVIVILSFAVGVLASFLGIGGGVVIVPLLPTLFNQITPIETLMISSFCVLSISAVNTFYFQKQKLIDYPLASSITIPLLIMGFLTVQVAVLLDGIYLRIFVWAVLVLTLLNPFRFFKIKRNIFSTTILGGLIGMIGSVTGVGMTVLSPILYQSKWAQTQKIAGSCNVSMIFSSIFIFLFYYIKIPSFNWSVAILMFSIFTPFAAFGSVFGRKLNQQVSGLRKLVLKILVSLLIIKMSYEIWTKYL